MEKLKYIIVTGYFSSGSSAVVDLLKEYKGANECTTEIKLIEDPYGIRQLEYNLTDGWDFLTSAAAIRDYLWLCKICGRRRSHFPLAPAGLGYSDHINKDFFRISKRYVSNLSDYTYRSDYYYQKFKKNYIWYVIDRCRFGIEYYSKRKLRTANRNGEISYFSHPTKNKFYTETQKYFDALFAPFFKEENSFVILDQALPALFADKIDKYFSNAKLIIVDRDPRDMFIEDIINWGGNMDGNPRTKESGENYIKRYKALRGRRIENPNVLYVQFEDLVKNYDKVVNEIESFTGLDETLHINKKHYFNPEVSIKNIGKWEQYYSEFTCAVDTISQLV